MRYRHLPLLFAFCILLSAALAQRPLPADRIAGAAAVDVETTRAWLERLSSPEFGGRGTGQDGYRLAADFVRDQFAALGLEPGAAAGSWFQDLPWTASKPDLEQTTLVFERDGKQVTVPATRLTGTVSKSQQASGGVVLLPPGSETDLDAGALEGKVAVALLPAAERGGAAAAGRGQAGPAFQLLRSLQGKGAAAIVLAQSEPVRGTLQGTSGPAGADRAGRGARMLPTVVTFGGDDLRELLQLAALPLAPTEPKPHALPIKARLAVTVAEAPAPACNVVGILRGSDARLNAEYVVIGSHLDHLGRRGERFFPGADDDASGTTGVLAVAQMLAKNPVRPARSVLFVCFCGEELGLVGSRHFAQQPPVPLTAIVAELQMDMIGRSEEEAHDGPRLVNKGELAEQNRNTVHLVGTQKLAPALHELCLRTNETAGFELEWDQESLFSRSDHANFARMGVPIAFFFTGLHRDYHQTTDTPEKIEHDKLLRVARWVYDLTFELATQSNRPRIDPELWEAYRGKGQQTPAAPLMSDGK